MHGVLCSQTTTAQHACCVELACKLSATRVYSQHTPHIHSGEWLIVRRALCLCACVCCCSFHHSVSSAELLRYSGHGRASSYAHTLATVSALLALAPTVTVASLCIRHACPAVAAAASNLLATYQQRLAASLPPAQRASLPLSSPPTVLAAFYCTAQQQKVKLDLQQLRRDCGVKADEWRRVLDSYSQLVGRESGMEDEHRRRQQRAKRKRQADCNEHDDELLHGLELDTTAAAAVPQLAGGRLVKYAEWRDRVVEDVERDDENRRATRRRQRGEDGGEGNEDDECEYGDDDWAAEARTRRAPRQTRLSFSTAGTGEADRRKAPTQSTRGGYTDVVVL